MSRARLAGLAVIAAAFAAALVWRLNTTDAGPEASAPTMSAATQAKPGPVLPAQTANPPTQSPQSASLAPEQSLEQAFHDAEDLLAFIDSIRPAAQAGDGASAWWIYRALRRCDTEYRSYFERGGRIRSLDETLQINAGNPFRPMDETRKLHAQCARLRDSRPGILNSWVNWLTMASDEIPLARIEFARYLMLEEKNRSNAGQREAARKQAIQALQSKDPAVVAGMRELAIRASDFDGSDGHFDWLLAGCQRGLDCSPQSEFVTGWCRGDPNCQPFEDVQAIVQRIAPAEYDGIERRAREINQLIDQGRIEELVHAALPNK